MKIQQHNCDLTLLPEMIEDSSVGMLTNINEHAVLTSRPMTPLDMDSEGCLGFFIDRTSVPHAKRLNEANLAFMMKIARFMSHCQAMVSCTTAVKLYGACARFLPNRALRKGRSRQIWCY